MGPQIPKRLRDTPKTVVYITGQKSIEVILKSTEFEEHLITKLLRLLVAYACKLRLKRVWKPKSVLIS